MKHASRKYHYVRVPLSRDEEVPEGMLTVAANRVEHLHRIAMLQPLQYLLTCAYMQGMKDAIDTFEKRELFKPA